MNIFSLIQDWWKRQGPEHWDPECDEDIAYLRRQKAAAEAETRRLNLRLHRPDLSAALQDAAWRRVPHGGEEGRR